jgi:ABC-type nitrate/sulfonate/bicarbonate transport system substrate-binding protein
MPSDDTAPGLAIGRRRFLQYSGLATAGMLTTSALTACGSSNSGSSGATAVRLTTGLTVDQAPTIVGAAKGLFNANGITGKLRTFSVANDGAQAQLSG